MMLPCIIPLKVSQLLLFPLSNSLVKLLQHTKITIYLIPESEAITIPCKAQWPAVKHSTFNDLIFQYMQKTFCLSPNYMKSTL